MKIGVLVFVVCAMVLGLAISALADGYPVVLGDYLLLRVRCASGGYTAEQRADIIQKRANNLLELGKYKVEDIKIEQTGDQASIRMGDQLVITADWPEARANKTTPKALAEIWAAKLREIFPLAIPKVPADAEKAPKK